MFAGPGAGFRIHRHDDRPDVKHQRLRVAVLFNPPVLPPDHPSAASERDVVAAARAVAVALRGEGFRAWTVAARAPLPRLVRSLSRQRPDVVFNLIEGYAGRSVGESRVTGVLELMGLPYTGCPPEAMDLCRHKGRAKLLLQGAGLPTAPFRTIGPDEPIADGPPVIEKLGQASNDLLVKPAAEDASLGIDQRSVVPGDDRESLRERVETLRKSYGDVLIEAFLPGREFNVGVLALPEPEPLPVAEVVYESDPGRWPILTYDAKWARGSTEDRSSPIRCPAEIDPDLQAALAHLAVRAFRMTGCRDYARVDFRLDAEGHPNLLEINPNPDLHPDAGLARALRASGRAYGATLAQLVRRAWDRDRQGTGKAGEGERMSAGDQDASAPTS